MGIFQLNVGFQGGYTFQFCSQSSTLQDQLELLKLKDLAKHYRRCTTDEGQAQLFFGWFWRGPTSGVHLEVTNHQLVGGFKYFLFSPLPGEMVKFD